MFNLAGRRRQWAGPIRGLVLRHETAEVGAIEWDRKVHVCRSETVIENLDRGKRANILLQDSKGFGVRFESVNPGRGKLLVKKQDGSADVASDIEDDFR